MFPVQPFYSSVNKFQLNAVPSTQQPDVVDYNGKLSTTPDSLSHRTLMLVHFTPISEGCALDGCTATMTLNDKEFRGLPLTMVNISQLLRGLPSSVYSLSFEAIPSHVTLNVYEVKKIYEEELMYGMEDSASYTYKREDTQTLIQTHFPGRDNDKVSLVCPLAQRKIDVPCRGVLCRHVQCFDAFAYLGWNEATLEPSWCCPVCNNQVLVEDIRIDLFTVDILSKVAYECTSVALQADGSWEPLASKDDRKQR